jgi:hypothetical protein
VSLIFVGLIRVGLTLLEPGVGRFGVLVGLICGISVVGCSRPDTGRPTLPDEGKAGLDLPNVGTVEVARPVMDRSRVGRPNMERP